jgi:hypothetical protein
MEPQKQIIISGTYDLEAKFGPRLQLEGDFTKKAIDEVIAKASIMAYTFSPKCPEGRGMASFSVGDEMTASKLVDELNTALLKYGFRIDYKSSE